MGKFNVNLLILILVILVIIMQLRSCLAKESQTGQVNNVIVQSSLAASADGLDLEAVGGLLSQASNAEELEQLLNQKGGINNLDLNGDGVVDFIKVTEFGSGDQRGFALSTELAAGEEQEIATIRIQKVAGQQQSQADVQVQGNSSLYGPNTYYHSRIGLGEMLFFAWLFRPHTPYYSPFAWGYYPGYYGGGYRTVNTSTYRSRASAAKSRTQASYQKSSKPQFRATASSPKAGANAGANTASRRSSLSSPSRSQRSFSTRSTTPSIRSSSALRSGSSFGGGK